MKGEDLEGYALDRRVLDDRCSLRLAPMFMSRAKKGRRPPCVLNFGLRYAVACDTRSGVMWVLHVAFFFERSLACVSLR